MTLTNTLEAPGDRSQIPAESQPIFAALSNEMQRIKAKAPANYKPHVDDTEKRLNILFDALNNSSLPAAAIAQLRDLANALAARDFDGATRMHTELLKSAEAGGLWTVGVKRLIQMSRATPV